MKVVVNKCFGGFGLSPLALKRLAELQGQECYFFKGISSKEVPCTIEEIGDTLFFSAYNVPNPQDYTHGDWSSMTSEERQAWNETYRKIRIDDMRGDRTNPLLIQVVEELGAGHRTGASGACAQLEIVEIPDGIEWEIDEYDGNESIHEKHRSW